MTDTEKVFVLVTRLRKRGLSDQGDGEHYAGYLLDGEGNYVPSPRMGFPLVVGGNESDKDGFTFSTEPIVAIFLSDEKDHWLVFTDNSAYEVHPKRVFH